MVANAIKFTPKNGKITVNVEQNELQTLVSIADNGIGISPDRIEKIFDDTSFETTYGTDSEKGSGLGLKLCKYFIELHKGKIWVESKVEKGSKFIFSIPIKL
jgi:signal transduction histidine kinase